MRLLKIAVTAGVLALPMAAAAEPGITTTDVNFRTGPGTSNASLGVLPGGTELDILDCEPGGNWCSVDVDGESGYVSGNYLQTTAVPVDEPPGTDVVEPTGDPTGPDGALLSDDELDTIVARIALYPDNLIAQILVAATYPLEIVKAGRWVDENKDLPADQREDATAQQGWDESVAMLAAGFPTVITMMADDLDWTENLGDAMLAQSDDVLDAVQRQRARAKALGNLETNDAQVVDTVNNTIVIEPAQPDKVYVPVYNPVTTYTQPAPAQPVYVNNINDGWDTGAVLATGAIAFGAGLAIGSVFDNDYRGYWYGPPRVHWDDRYIYPRPGVRPPPRPGWGRPGRPGWGRPGRPGRPRDVNINNINNINNVNINNVNVNNRPGARRNGAWRPDDRRRQQARRDIKRKHGNAARRPGATRPAGANRPGNRPNQRNVERRLKAGSGNSQRIAKATNRRGAAPRKAAPKRTGVHKPRQKSAPKARKTAARGKASKARRAAPRQSRPAQRQRAARAPQRRAAPRRTAIRKAPQARRSAAHRSRGARSRGGRGRGRGRR